MNGMEDIEDEDIVVRVVGTMWRVEYDNIVASTGTRHASPRAARVAAAEYIRKLVSAGELPYGTCPHFVFAGNECTAGNIACVWRGHGVASGLWACMTCGHRARVEWGYGSDR